MTSTTDDLAELEELDDQILCQCLNERYQLDQIYTYVGDILIAVNPFRQLGLYTNAVSAQYCNIHAKSDHPPHLFAIADSAYHAMKRANKAQVCVISGESGAGKTESAKQFIRQIMDVSARGLMGGADGEASGHVRAKHPVEMKIIQQNPILEAFGNAKTVMNDNSSRFGKFIELQFGGKGTVIGAELQHYLLEKARIVMQGPGERNYHIFGMMFAGLDRGQKDMYALTETQDYKYLPEDCGDQSELVELWEELQQAFDDCGFSAKERDEMNSILAAILQMGNLDFVEGDQGDAAVIGNKDCAEIISRGLMVDQGKMEDALLTALLNMRGEIIVKNNNIDKAANATRATAKSLYDKLFQWLVYKVNLTLRCADSASDRGAASSANIAILDIFGFENFKQNGFDQMCINLANEQLQYFFNQHIFAAEMGSYAAEGLELGGDILFSDNKAALDMFFRRPIGLLALLDEECNFPKASAKSLLNKFNKNLAAEPLYNEVKGDYAFEVVHYAGAIHYHAEGYIEKNTDPLPDLIPPCFEASKSSLLRMMYNSEWDLSEAVNDSRGKSKRGLTLNATKKGRNKTQKKSRKTLNKRHASQKKSRKAGPAPAPSGGGGGGKKSNKNEPNTVSAHFRISLAGLMSKMGLCDPHFIRCIKPNAAKVPHKWEVDLVLRQLTYTGMLQTVQMRREGYPFRIPFAEFFEQYHGIVWDFKCPMKGDAQTCKELLTKLEEHVDAKREERGLTSITTKLSGWKVAKSMIFLKYWHVDLLDGLTYPFGVSALRIQTCFRAYIARKKFEPMKQKFADECAMAATFVGGIFQQQERVQNALETLQEEEDRRGPIDLGIAKPIVVKEVKKAQKERAKGVVAQVDAKKFEKDLAKVKKGVVKWWIRMERAKGIHVDEDGNVYPWFHGLISRVEAEDYLFDQPSGAFLVRVSERVHGYALSFRHNHRIRHYKLGFSRQGGYEVVGNNEDFSTLLELIEYYGDHAITNGSDDQLTEGVQFDHDLGLGIEHTDDISGKSPKQRMSKEERENRSKTMVNLETEAEGDPMPYSAFLESDDAKPRWLRGKLSRYESEKELEDRGLVDGRFLVREKGRWPQRIVLALSVSYRRKFYHHLLTKTTNGEWHLDEKRMDFRGALEEVIRYLQKRKSPRLATVLEADVPEAPEGVATKSAAPSHAATKAAAKQTRSTLVPSPTSTVDDVVAWLASLGLAKYAGGFYKSKFDGKKLHKATEKQLRKIVKSEDDYILMVRALR